MENDCGDGSKRDRARRLRREQTDAERRLWANLRNHRLGVKFRRQHPIGPFVADFFCLEARLVIELDGGQHNLNDRQLADSDRTRYMQERGYRVLRFWDDEVLVHTDAVLQAILEEL